MAKGRKKIGGEQREMMGDPSNGKSSIVKTAHLVSEFTKERPFFLDNELSERIWDDFYPVFKDLGFISGADKPLLGRYCETFADYIRIKNLLHQPLLDEKNQPIVETREQNVYTYETDSNHGKMRRVDPLWGQLRDTKKELLRCEKELCMTGLDRQNMYMKIMEYGGVGQGRGGSPTPDASDKPANQEGILPLSSPLGWGKPDIKH